MTHFCVEKGILLHHSNSFPKQVAMLKFLNASVNDKAQHSFPSLLYQPKNKQLSYLQVTSTFLTCKKTHSIPAVIQLPSSTCAAMLSTLQHFTDSICFYAL